MNVTLTDEQKLLRGTVAALADSLACAADPITPDAPPRDDAAAWTRVVEIGLPALRSADDGRRSGTLEAALAVEELARRLVRAPLIGTLLAADLLTAAGRHDVATSLTERGRPATVVLRTDLTDVAGAGLAWDWSSDALVVAVVDDLVVVADAGEPRPLADLTRRLVRAEAAVPALQLGRVTVADLLRWRALGAVLVSADIVGALAGALAAAVAHARVRTQFGRPVGAFQAVQHMAAEQHVLVEAGRSAVWHAAWAVDALTSEEAMQAASTAKAFCSEVARDVAEATLQIWGGLGMTWECPAHLHLRRVLVDREAFGDEELHLTRLADARLPTAG